MSRAICVVLNLRAFALFWAARCYQVFHPKQVTVSPRSQTKQAAERDGRHTIASEVQQTAPMREDMLDGDRSGFLQRKLMKDGIFTSIGPPPFHGSSVLMRRAASLIVSKFILRLLINFTEVLEHAEVQCGRRAYMGAIFCEV
ncbi:hypothetical protein DFH08DRAFT_814398 [Mycena albidolilacea]|uniref:Secreted protein n=1 Tax=Mycena albidolilacea TaxID=1033008 RepID=A0AAD6ZP64_9AGAR|nr:hypothetical protein DFH08DRAFT_814398 [Mycena albidolilacea]